MFFIELPFRATYCASKHALQVCTQDQNTVKSKVQQLLRQWLLSHNRIIFSFLFFFIWCQIKSTCFNFLLCLFCLPRK